MDDKLREIAEQYSENQFAGCGLVYCVTCQKYVGEGELEAHEKHELVDSLGKVITKRVIKRMKGEPE